MKKGGFSPVGHGESEREGKAVGKGNFANMPQEVSMKPYPKAKSYKGRDLDDTISEIDSVTRMSEGKAQRYLSKQH